MVSMLEFSKSYVSLLRLRYGISPDDFKAIVEFQNGVCPLCLRSLMITKIVVDHDGSTFNGAELKALPVAKKRKLVRGILHYDCNVRLGWLEKFPWLISEHARKYIDSSPAQEVLSKRNPPPDGRRRRRPASTTKFRTVSGIEQKWCSGHQNWHPLSSFSERPERTDGYARSCILYLREYYRKRNQSRTVRLWLLLTHRTRVK